MKQILVCSVRKWVSNRAGMWRENIAVMYGKSNIVKIEIKNKLNISGLNEAMTTAICERLTFVNPKWRENEKQGRWNGETPRVLRYYEPIPEGISVPRGFVRQLINLSRACGEPFKLNDQRRALPPVDFDFRGQLKGFQVKAVNEMLAKDFGTLSAATGSGKTVMALYMIAKRKQPTLVITHTKELLNQWVDRIETFLGIPADEVGIIGGGKKRIGEKVTVALVQSLCKCAHEVSQQIGHLIVDECHRAPARTFTEAVSAFDSRYMLGLSATPWRRDKLSKLIFWHVGDVIHEVDKGDLIQNGHILKAEVITRETNFKPFYDPTNEYSKMLSELTEDSERNELIASDVTREAQNGNGICLVLSDRKAHCEALQAALSDKFGVSSEVLTGDRSSSQRKDIVSRLNAGKIKILIATGQLIGEGFDLPALSTLFLSTPIRFSGRTIQYMGRILRPAPGKRQAKLYDYIDPVGVLKASAKARRWIYRDHEDQYKRNIR